MYEGELLTAAMELTTRGAMLTWSLFELVKRREARNLQWELDEEKKTLEMLRIRLEDLVVDHAVCVERRSTLQAELDEAYRQLTKSAESLKVTWARDDALPEEVVKLKVEVRRLGKKGDELAIQSERLSTELIGVKNQSQKLTPN